MSLGPGWWLRKPSTPNSPNLTPRHVEQKVNVNRYLQQSGHVHLPGIVPKPKVNMPNLSVQSPRKRKTWQIGDVETSFPTFKPHSSKSKLHRYSDSNLLYPTAQVTRPYIENDPDVESSRSSNHVSAFSNHILTRSSPRRKQWNRSKNVILSLVSDVDPYTDGIDSVATQNCQRNPMQNHSHMSQQRTQYQRNHGLESMNIVQTVTTHEFKLQSPYNQHSDKFSYPTSARSKGFLPQINTNRSDVSPRKSWSSPITHYEDPTVFWVDMGNDTGTCTSD